MRSFIFKFKFNTRGYKKWLIGLSLGILRNNNVYIEQTTFENIIAKEEILHNEPFLPLPQCFQLCLIIILSFNEMSITFPYMFLKSSAADVSCVGKRLKMYIFY